MAQYDGPMVPRFTDDSSSHVLQLEVSVPKPSYWRKKMQFIHFRTGVQTALVKEMGE